MYGSLWCSVISTTMLRRAKSVLLCCEEQAKARKDSVHGPRARCTCCCTNDPKLHSRPNDDDAGICCSQRKTKRKRDAEQLQESASIGHRSSSAVERLAPSGRPHTGSKQAPVRSLSLTPPRGAPASASACTRISGSGQSSLPIGNRLCEPF